MNSNDVAVVTGAASGIGAALARRLHRRGARLVLADVDDAPLSQLADELAATAVLTDVSDPDAMERLAAATSAARLVCLNAGIVSTHPGPVWEAPHSEWQTGDGRQPRRRRKWATGLRASAARGRAPPATS